MASNEQWVPCTIENSGFPSERRFEAELVGGDRAVGTSDIQHLRDAQHRQLVDGVPEYRKQISGFVKCRIVRQAEDGTLVLEFPGADVFRVQKDALATSR